MRTMILAFTVIFTASALVPTALTAQDPDPERGGEARIQATLDAAARTGIPLSLLESKLQEGRAKGVADVRIAAALDARLEALIRARETMEQGGVESMSAGDLSVAADALEAGVSESALLGLQTSMPGENRAVAIAVLSSLVRLGEGSETALARVRTALEGGPGALADLRTETSAMLRARGLVPPVDLDAVVGVGGGLGIG